MEYLLRRFFYSLNKVFRRLRAFGAPWVSPYHMHVNGLDHILFCDGFYCPGKGFPQNPAPLARFT
jgi:hypothetical protein